MNYSSMGKMFINILGVEAIVFGLTALILVQANKRLRAYLNRFHQRFLEENLSSPFCAGDRTVMRQQLRVVRNTYFAIMPDETSRFLQRKMRSRAILVLLSLLLFAGTLIGGAIYLLSAGSN